VAHRSEKFFMVEWLDEESRRADSKCARAKDSSIPFATSLFCV